MDSRIARLGAAAGWLSLAMIFGYHIGLTIVAGQRVSGTMDAAAIEGYYRSGVIAPASIAIFLSVVPILIFALALRELFGAGRGRCRIREQRVPRHDVGRLFDHDLTCFHQRWSPFHGGVAASVAYEITRSLIFSSTQLKLSSLMENESKSGAGLRKSIA